MSEPESLGGQPCSFCGQNTLTLTEHETEVPYFGKMAMFSMDCSNCKYHKSDIEALEQQDPATWTFEIESEEDMKVRVIKSSEATIKIPHITTITPGPASQGFVSNIEGIFRRVKHQVETAKEAADDQSEKKSAKNMLKKIQNIMWGQQKQKIIIEDPSGNSAIISEKAVKSALKVKKK